MGRRGPTVEQAEAEVARLEAAAAQWRAEAAGQRAKLEELQASLGDQVLEGVDARQLHVAADDLRILIAGAEAAAESADRKLTGARPEVIRAKAREVRKRADAAVQAADAHQGKVDSLLAQVRELESADYVWIGPPEGATSWTIPTSDSLRHEANQLMAEADALDQRAADAEQGAERAPAAYGPRALVSFAGRRR